MSSSEYREFSEKTPVKGRLKDNVNFWKIIEANDFILNTISNGYEFPFSSLPNSEFFKNNRSALDNSEFVLQAINDLLSCGAVVESATPPLVVNPLTVADNVTKKRLVLDLRHVNKFPEINIILQPAFYWRFFRKFSIFRTTHS